VLNPIKRLVRKLRNIFAPPNVSGCLICGDKWSWKKHHNIPYSENNYAFPVCEECWQTAPSKSIMMAVRELGQKWIWQSPAAHLIEATDHAQLLIIAAEEQLSKRGEKIPLSFSNSG
jgi:hypothetical protein